MGYYCCGIRESQLVYHKILNYKAVVSLKQNWDKMTKPQLTYLLTSLSILGLVTKPNINNQ